MKLFFAALGRAACATAEEPPRQPEDAAIEAAAHDPLAACAAVELPEPRTIADVVARIDALPEPTIECLIASLPRPVGLVASSSATSLQPAVDASTPRILVLYDRLSLSLSVVGGGDGAHRVELGE